MKKQITLISSVLLLGYSAQSQTIADFEIALPSNDTSYLETFSTDGDYSFSNGNIALVGNVQYNGDYRTGFNYSNRKNDSVGDWTNQWSAITASGYNNSSNYGIAYIEGDYSNFSITKIYNIDLLGSAQGKYVLGTYVTNTTYAYKWIEENYNNGDYLHLIFKGYNNGNLTNDSVVVNLATKDSATFHLINSWEWVDLTTLGAIDSVALQMRTNNLATPYYFAFDNFTTSDGVCPNVSDLNIANITYNKASISWKSIAGNYATNYEIALDTINTNTPSANATIYNVSGQLNYNFDSLIANTNYVAYVRTICTDTNATWEKIGFTTSANSINDNKNVNINVYPNPTNGIVHISGINDIDNIYVINVEGKVLATSKNNASINISNLPTGNYILRIASAKGSFHQIINKQ